MTKKKPTYETILAELRALRLDRDKADARFLLRLLAVEQNHWPLIHAAGHESFATFIEQVNLTKPGRYESFKLGVEKVGATEALSIGSDATIIAGQLSNGADEYTDACEAWKEKHGGVLPTRQAARLLLLQVDPKHRTPQSVKERDNRNTELARLRAENSELRADNRALKSRVAKLEQQLKKRQGSSRRKSSPTATTTPS